MELFFAPDEMPSDVVESASKHRQSIFWSPSAITVITREDIRGSGATTFIDLLRRVPGFEVIELKPSYPVAGTRALTDFRNNLVLVLVDGREILAEFTGTTFWSALPFDLDEVERVEVIRGPGSALYGANAFAAVVNVTTSERASKSGRFSVSTGEQGRSRLLGKTHGSLKLGRGELTIGASLGGEAMYSTSDPGEQLLADYRTYGKLRYREGPALDLTLQGGVIWGEGLFYTMMGDLYLRDGFHYFVMGQGQFEIVDWIGLKAQLYLSSWKAVFHPRVTLRAWNIWISDLPDFGIEFPTFDSQLQLDFRISEDILVIGGANFRYIYLDSDNFIPRSFDEYRGAGFFHARWGMEQLQVTGGVRFDLSSNFEPALSPRAAIVYRPWPEHAFRVSYGWAFRKPCLYESHVHPDVEIVNPAMPEAREVMARSIGNEDLHNEKVQSVEIGWRAKFLGERLLASIDLFVNMYSDMITFVIDLPLRMGLPDMQNSNIRYDNQDDRFTAFGGEAELSWRPLYSWTLWGNLAVKSLRTPDHPGGLPSEKVFRINLGARYLPEFGLLADLALHYLSASSQAVMDPQNMLNDLEYLRLDGGLLLVGRIGYRLRLGEDRSLEAGLTVRAPLGGPFREYPGIAFRETERSISAADFGGEMLRRVVACYLRGSF